MIIKGRSVYEQVEDQDNQIIIKGKIDSLGKEAN